MSFAKKTPPMAASMDVEAGAEPASGDTKTSPCSPRRKLVGAGLCLVGIAVLLAVLALTTCAFGCACGYSQPYASKDNVCVEVPPKVVDTRRRLADSNHVSADDGDYAQPTTEQQSMRFFCRASTHLGVQLSAEAQAECTKKCTSDMIFLKQVFLVEDEDDDRKSWVGGHVRVVVDERPQNFNMDFSRGCASVDDYLAQDFTDRTKFNCGLSELGYDLLFKKASKTTSESCLEEQERDGVPYCYATMQNLDVGSFLQQVLRSVRSGARCAGIHTAAFPKAYDHIIPGCVAEYKVDVVIPLGKAPIGSVTSCNMTSEYEVHGFQE
jgi:hypothetical protein